MQGFNMGKYYPPDFDPTKGGLNKQQGKHPLGDRQASESIPRVSHDHADTMARRL